MSHRLQLNLYCLGAGATPTRAVSTGSGRLRWFVVDRGVASELDADEVPGRSGVVVAVRENAVRESAWRAFIRSALDGLWAPAEPGASEGAIVFTPVEHEGSVAWLAWAFGYGSHLLRDAATEPRFGLKLALNLLVQVEPEIDGDQESVLNALSYRTVVDEPRASDHRSSRSVGTRAFRMDRLVDSVSRVGGRVEVEGLDIESNVVGGRSLHLQADVDDLDDLVVFGVELLPIARRTDYLSRFDWVDDLVEVREEPTRGEVLARCAAALLGRGPSGVVIDVLLPDEVCEDHPSGDPWTIVFPGEVKGSGRQILSFEILKDWLVSKRHDADRVLSRQVRFLVNGDEQLAVPIQDLVVAEVEVDGGTYIVNRGEVLRPSKPYLERVQSVLEAIPRYDGLDWAPGRYFTRERDFNRRTVELNSARALLLDGKLIRGGGESPVEACDILTVDGHFVHAKRKDRSSTFSHVCHQALTAAQLIRSDETYRAALRATVEHEVDDAEARAAFLEAIDRAARAAANATLVIALFGQWPNPSLRALPLLARISLMDAARRAGELGFGFEIALIDGKRAEVDLRDVPRTKPNLVVSSGRNRARA